MTSKDIATLVRDSGLRGRGGGGFGTGVKWSFMPPPDGGPRYLAVNADESEPGTFKDRQIMERNPHLFIEGVMICAMGIEAAAAFIYVRGEYAECYRLVRQAIRECYEAGILREAAVGFTRRVENDDHTVGGPYLCRD